MRTLEDMEPIVDAAAYRLLTHAIEYKIGSGPWRTIRVQGSYEDIDISSGVSGVLEQQIELLVDKNDVPNLPSSEDRLRLPRVGNKLFKPINPRDEVTARQWLINVKTVPV